MPTPKDAPYKLAQQGKNPTRFVPIPRHGGGQGASDAERIRAEYLRRVLVEWAASKRPAKGDLMWPELAPLTNSERAEVRSLCDALDADALDAEQV